MADYFLVRPLEELSIRGNRGFGMSGEHGQGQMPPWPSLFAGAFRSAILGRDPKVLAAFGRDGKQPDGEVGRVLGTPEKPGDFRLTWSSMALPENTQPGATPYKEKKCLPASPAPEDLVVSEGRQVAMLEPQAPPAGLKVRQELPLVAVHRSAKPGKPVSGSWLSGAALDSYIKGEIPASVLECKFLYSKSARVGNALDNGSRTVRKGMLYSSEQIALKGHAGFLVGIEGLGEARREFLPDVGMLRFGGDGRAAQYEYMENQTAAVAPIEQIGNDRRFKLVIISPGIFAKGWIPDGVERDGENWMLRIGGFSARLACAAMGRHDTVSGWDLAKWRPKPASRVVPTGSVYWFDRVEGQLEQLEQWMKNGIWSGNPDDLLRQVEGFNRAVLAAWPTA
jgi:CRISPR-associated protein Cmr3